MTASVHISLKVRDLDSSVEFYRGMFGEPAKLKEGYAKFVTREPQIHLALGPGLEASPGAGALSHLGIRVGSTAEVERWRSELLDRGLTVEEPKRSECCYALQDKFWLTDPDGNRWEIYTVLKDVEEVAPESVSACCPPATAVQDGDRLNVSSCCNA